jgi:transposase
MLSLVSSVRIFLCLTVADMRRSFDGLARMVEEVIERDPLAGHLYVFRNRRGDRLKILLWQGDGYAIWYKRLEEGTFAFPVAEADCLAISAAQLAMILEGVEIEGIKKRRRYKKINLMPNLE